MATFAVTGATGFIGRALTKALLSHSHQVRVLVRHPNTALPQPVQPILGTLENRVSLEALAESADVVIHLAGLTAALDRRTYFKTNAAGTAQLLAALESRGTPTPLVHVSSLAAREPELSDYSASKRAAETLVESANLPWTIVRPPAVYGPDDAALRPLWRLMRAGFLPKVGAHTGRFSLLHVDDLAEALVRLGEALIEQPTAPLEGQVYELDDQFVGALGPGYDWNDLADIAQAVFGKRPKLFGVPGYALTSLAAVYQTIGKMRQRPPVFNLGKARELSHADWVTQYPSNWTQIEWSPHRQLRDTLAYL